MNFKTGLVMSFLMAIAAPAMADNQLTLNGGSQYMYSCGGSIEATSSSDSTQMNLVVRNVSHCSNFVLWTTGQEYKIPGPDGNRSGSFTIPAGRLESGWNVVQLTVRSNSGAHADNVKIMVYVTPAQPCATEAAQAAKSFSGNYYSTAQTILDRVSNSGNYVFYVTLGYSKYEIVTNPYCAILNKRSM